MKSHNNFESLGYTAEDAYRNKSAADSRAEEIRRQEPGVQAVVFEDKDIPHGGLRYVVYVSGGNRRSDNPLKCSECGSLGVYKAGMCDECYGRKDNPRGTEVPLLSKWKRRGRLAGSDEAVNDVRDRKPSDDVSAKKRILNTLPADISHNNLNEWHDGFDEEYNRVYDRLARRSNTLKYGTLKDNPSWQGVKERFRRGYHRARAAAMSPRVQSVIGRFPQVASAVAPHVGLSDNPTGAISHRDIYEFNQYLKNATDAQVEGVYEKERAAGRTGYATLAKMEIDRRRLSVSRRDNPSRISKSQHELAMARISHHDRELSKLRSARNAISIGDRVVDADGDEGVVSNSYGNGAMFEIQYDYGRRGKVHPDSLTVLNDNPSLKHDTDTKQYYHVRIRPPKRGEEFRTIEFKPDVKAVIGIHAKKGPRGGRSDIQKLLFDKDRFTVTEIKSWLKENGFGRMK